jgi:hypothetical protein
MTHHHHAQLIAQILHFVDLRECSHAVHIVQRFNNIIVPLKNNTIFENNILKTLKKRTYRLSS